MSEEQSKAQILVDICKNKYVGSNISNCNYFVDDVARELGHKSFSGRNANSIVDFLDASSASWTEVSGKDAAMSAAQGVLVIAGLRSWEYKHPKSTHGHGHVAIVIPGPLYLGKYPKVYCGGGPGGQSEGKKSSGEVWREEDRNQVHYYKALW